MYRKVKERHDRFMALDTVQKDEVKYKIFVRDPMNPKTNFANLVRNYLANYFTLYYWVIDIVSREKYFYQYALYAISL